MLLGYTNAPWGWKRTRKRPLTEDAAWADAAEWMKLLEWKWDMRMALRNCYWFCNRSMQINTSKLLDHSFAELVAPEQEQANDQAICSQLDAFSLVDKQNITRLHKDTFRFETVAVARTGVLEQIVFLSKTLNGFVEACAIVNLKYQVSRPDSGELRVALENFCRSLAMLPSAAAPAAATSGSPFMEEPPPPPQT
jgi:hypothetical protein